MPTNKILVARGARANATLSPEDEAFLLDRPLPPGGSPLRRFLRSEEDERDLWVLHRDTILRRWIRSHPGTRPRAWWLYDSPEPRRLLSGSGQPAHLVSAYAEQYVLGIVTVWAGFSSADPPVFETQSDFLKRHRLLFTGERSCAREDEPEVRQLHYNAGIPANAN